MSLPGFFFDLLFSRVSHRESFNFFLTKTSLGFGGAGRLKFELQ